ncbi:MAG: RNA polymerase factor sigma-54 [Planctomycetota bacterium]
MAMSMNQSQSMRMDQRQLLTPRMIQSMEILQMPLAQLEERIEQELQQNPTLELKEKRGDEKDRNKDENGEPLLKDNEVLEVNGTDNGSEEDFARLEKIADYLENEEWSSGPSFGPGASSYAGERDGKLDAMANTAARSGTLGEELLDQWRFVEAAPSVRKAGEILIGYIDADGYIRQTLEEVVEQAEQSNGRTALPPMDDFTTALGLIQRTLDPAGVGARNLRECLLIQLAHIEQDPEMAEGHDLDLERELVRDHLKDLEMNRYPQISKRTGRDIETLKRAVARLGRLHPHPGRQVGGDNGVAITPDAIITYNEDTGNYDIQMTYDPAPNLYIRGMYRKMLKEKGTDKTTKEFLTENVRNAKWLLESIQQRRSTIERVIERVVHHQRDFFDKGAEFLKPLPMIQVGEELGIHVATVSRAVAEKHIQTPKGIFPLRRFFSGGTTTEDGQDMSWDAVKEKLKTIVNEEDKSDPLSDDQIVEKLNEQGIELARRTVAKYRKLLNLPTARQRKEY